MDKWQIITIVAAVFGFGIEVLRKLNDIVHRLERIDVMLEEREANTS